MLKLISCVKRQPHLTREQFDDYWLNHHGPLVSSLAKTLGIRQYIQTIPYANSVAQHALQVGRGTLPVEFDGCAELWWDSLESHLAARKTADGLEALRLLIEDEKRFVDLTHSQFWYGEERTIIHMESKLPE